MTIEHTFDVPFVAALALQEKQIEANRIGCDVRGYDIAQRVGLPVYPSGHRVNLTL